MVQAGFVVYSAIPYPPFPHSPSPVPYPICASAMVDPNKPRPTDNAFLGALRGGSLEPTYGGALSFMRRRYGRDLDRVDAVVWGVPFDAAVSNRPGARFRPRAIRRASAPFAGDPPSPL